METDNLFVAENATIMNALNIIDLNAKGLAFIVDENMKIKGTITDGDIRRAILKGINLNSDIEHIYNRSYKYVSQNYTDEQVKKIFRENKIRCIPVLDEEKKFVDLLEVSDFESSFNKENPVLIMAGGLGTRLRPLTDDIPKPMLKIGDKPILQIIIEQFRNKGFKNILLSVNYKSEIIENYFKDGSEFDVSIKYIKENKRMGTAGAIRLAKEYINNAFFVINGDVITTIDVQKLLDFHLKNNYSMSVGSRNYEVQIPYGVLNLKDNCVTSLQEKPIIDYYVSAGIYVLDPKTIEFIPENQYFDITELIEALIKVHKRVGSYPINEYWMDIGQLKDYYKANEDIKNIF